MQATLRTHYLPEPHYHGPFTTSRSALPTDKLDLPSHRRRNDLCAPPGILRHLRPLQYLVRFFTSLIAAMMAVPAGIIVIIVVRQKLPPENNTTKLVLRFEMIK